MGGVGSGRYRWDRRALTVEECWALAVRTVEGAPVFELRAPDRSGDAAVEVACPDGVELTTVRPHFGGVRWLFRCPGLNGTACGRRAGKLYAYGPAGEGFACRRCHGLTYRSCQQSHRWTGLSRLMAEHPSLGRLRPSVWRPVSILPK
jgi:hypothetical protein